MAQSNLIRMYDYVKPQIRKSEYNTGPRPIRLRYCIRCRFGPVSLRKRVDRCHLEKNRFDEIRSRSPDSRRDQSELALLRIRTCMAPGAGVCSCTGRDGGSD